MTQPVCRCGGILERLIAAGLALLNNDGTAR
jgi:hypothetical protein